MKERRESGSRLVLFGSAKTKGRSTQGSNRTPWLFVIVVWACIWVSGRCDAQIEVEAYIPNFSSNNVSVIDTQTNTVIGSPIAVGTNPIGVALTPDGRFVYVTNASSNTVSVIDHATNTAVGSPILVGAQPIGIAVTPNGGFAYVANANSNTVSVINTATDTVVGSPILVGARSIGIAITPNGSFAYVTNQLGNTVSVINTATNTVVGSPIPVQTEPTGIVVTPDGRYTYLTNYTSGSVSVINTATNTQVGSPITVGVQPNGIAITPDGKFVYVRNTGSNTVSVIDTTTNAVITSIPVPTTPPTGSIAITPDGRFAYATSSTNTVTVINTATNTVVGSPIPVGAGPGIPAVGPNIIVAPGGPLSIANDAALTPLGFGQFVDFNGGTLRTTGSLVTARTISLLALGGTIDTNGLNSILSGNIINTGSLTKMGAGTLTLGGSNTYTGGTTITAGTLQLGNGGTSGRIVGNVTDNGTLAFDHSDVVTFAGVISGTGGVAQIGAGTTILTGANTYAGTTTVNAGTLQAGAANSAFGNNSSVTLNAGTLNLNNFNETIGSLAGASGTSVALGSGTLSAGGNNTSTLYAGVISGSGGLNKTGAGTLTLTGPNAYTGGTTISGGALQLGNGGPSGSIRGNVADNGTLVFNRSDTVTFPGLIFGTGGVAQIGPGTTILTADNTYTGGTIISAGTLQLGNGGATGGIPGNVTDNGTLAFNRSDTVTFGGVVFGTGALVQMGPGTTILTANDSYTGGTTISAGTLQLGNGGTTGSIVGNVTDNGSLLFDRSDNVTFNAIISGSGNLVQNGSGTTILGGTNTYSGGTIINNGTLLVNRAQALGLGDVTVNGGVLGADPQPINVKGNYTQNGGGTLQLNVAGPNSGQYDFLHVGGNAALGGTLQLISLGFQPSAGEQLSLVTTSGVVSGRFARFGDPFTQGPGLNTINLVYGRNLVVLQFLNLTTPISPAIPTVPTFPSPPLPPQFPPGLLPKVIETVNFTSFALTPNQVAAATLLDEVQLNPKTASLFDFLYKEPFANLPADFEKISPGSLTAFYEISFSGANIQKLNLEGRLDDIHNGSNGFSSNMKLNGATVNPEDKAGENGKSSKGVVEPILQPGPQNRWGVWVTGFGDFVNVDGDGNANGYDFTTGGFTLGIDYRITDQLVIGAMGDYSHTWTSLQPSGDIDVDSGRGGLYATWFSHGIYLNGAIYGRHNTYESSRSSLGGLATGSTEGAEWSTFISGGYDFHFGHLTVGPIASLQYTYVSIDGFSENGSLAPLAIHSGSAESLRSDVGFRVFYQWQIGKIVLEPSLKAAWEHEYKYSALPITAGFAGIPGPSATFFGPSEGHDSAIVSAGVSVHWTPAIATYVNYDGQLGRDRYDSNAVTGGVRISF